MDWKEIYQVIPTVIEELKRDYVLENIIIRTDIFNILEKHCTVIYYPLTEEKNCGFHTKRFVKDHSEDFVYINTAKKLPEQVFTAAHELGHVWGVVSKIKERVVDCENISQKEEEQIINRFAAELLMPRRQFEKTFYFHLKELCSDFDDFSLETLIKTIVMQMNDYMVPYEAVRRRLVETEILTVENGILLKENEKSILTLVDIFSKDINTMLDNVTGKKTVPGLRNLLENIEKNQLLDICTIKKIKKDFEISDVTVSEDVLNIRIGDKKDGEKQSNS